MSDKDSPQFCIEYGPAHSILLISHLSSLFAQDPVTLESRLALPVDGNTAGEWVGYMFRKSLVN